MIKSQIRCVRCKRDIFVLSDRILHTRKGSWSYCECCRRPPKAA